MYHKCHIILGVTWSISLLLLLLLFLLLPLLLLLVMQNQQSRKCRRRPLMLIKKTCPKGSKTCIKNAEYLNKKCHSNCTAKPQPEMAQKERGQGGGEWTRRERTRQHTSTKRSIIMPGRGTRRTSRTSRRAERDEAEAGPQKVVIRNIWHVSLSAVPGEGQEVEIGLSYAWISIRIMRN